MALVDGITVIMIIVIIRVILGNVQSLSAGWLVFVERVER
jgi:hypothetical protein